MQRFFVEPHQIDRDRHEIHITGNDVNHIVNVLRMKKDEELWISDKEKEYHCVIENAGENEVLLHILYVQEPDYELQNRIYLFQGLPKADKMELIMKSRKWQMPWKPVRNPSPWDTGSYGQKPRDSQYFLF